MKKKNWIIIGIVSTIFVITIPIVIGCGVSADILNNFTNSNDWIGFWGSYVGTIVGGMITLAVLYFTITNENNNKKREERIQYFDNIINEWASVSATLANLCFYVNKFLNKQDEDCFERIILYNNEIVKLGTSFIIKIEIRVKQYRMSKLKEEYEGLINSANHMMQYFENDNINEEDKEEIKSIMYCMEERATKISALVNKTVQENIEIY